MVGARLSLASSRSSGSSAGATTELNAWIHVGHDNQIEFILDKAEMGQGVITGLTAIVAEEMDVGLYSIRVKFAPVGDQYKNPAFLAQMTGGSTSVAASWDPLRQAAAEVKARLVGAAASSMGVDPNQCVIALMDGTNYGVVDKKSGKQMSFGQVTSAAAGLNLKKGSVQPKTRSQYRLLGKDKPITRYDAWDKVTGRTKYGIDTSVSETGSAVLNCVILRCPVSGGKLVDYQPRLAQDLGVSYLVKLKGGLAVVAPTFWQALQASRKIKCQWDFGPGASVNTADMQKSFRETLKTKRGDLVSIYDAALSSYETKLQAFKQCKTTADVIFEVPYVPHATMEPMNCTAFYQAGRCDIWVGSQAPAAAREVARLITGLKQENIEVHTSFLGGGFGRRGYQDFVAEAVQVSFDLFQQFKVVSPVKVTWTREDDFKHDYYRPIFSHRVQVGVKDDGTLGAWLHHLVGQSIFSYVADGLVDSIAKDSWPDAGATGRLLDASFNLPSIHALHGSQLGAGILDPNSFEGLVTDASLPNITHLPFACRIPYVTENFHLEYTHVKSNTPVGFWRSVGHSHTAFAKESVLDDLAHDSHRDPMEFRESLLKNALKSSSSYLKTVEGAAERIKRLQKVLDSVKKHSQWGSAPSGCSQGVALHESFDTFVAMVINVSLPTPQTIKVEHVFAAIDCGFVLTPDIVRAQVQGSIVFGLSAALKQEITLVNGQVQQNNFYDCDILRMHECPEIHVAIVDSDAKPSGVGEPGVPPVAPALRNAILAATKKRLYKLPLNLNEV